MRTDRVLVETTTIGSPATVVAFVFGAAPSSRRQNSDGVGVLVIDGVLETSESAGSSQQDFASSTCASSKTRTDCLAASPLEQLHARNTQLIERVTAEPAGGANWRVQTRLGRVSPAES